MTATQEIYERSSFITTATWKVGNIYTDPSTVKLKFQLVEGGAVTTWVFGTDVQIVHVGPGVFTAIVPTTQDGIAIVQWEGTGVAANSFWAKVPVRKLPLP